MTPKKGIKKKKKKKDPGDNPVLNAARRLLGNPKNKAPAAKFYQSQKRKELMIKKMLGQ